MTLGDRTVTEVERRMQYFAVRVMVSRRVVVTPEMWRLELLSPFWRIYVVETEGASIRVGGRWWKLLPDTVVLLPAWMGFGTMVSGSVDQSYVHFSVSGLSTAWLRQTFDGPMTFGLTGELEPLVAAWRSALDLTVEGPFGAFAWAGALAHALLARAMGEILPGQREKLDRWLAAGGGVEAAVACVESRLADPPGNAELAALCGIGVDQLTRRFRARTGLTPVQYGLERRVLAAADALAGSEATIEAIAEATGFTDRFYLTRMFKARLGLTPAAYRRMHRLERSGRAAGGSG